MENQKGGSSNFKLSIWTPSLSGSFSFGYVKTILEAQMEIQKAGGVLEWGVISGNSVLPIARNRAVANFMNGDSTHFMFLDDDIGVSGKDILSCVTSGLEFTAIPYQRRGINLDKISKATKDSIYLSPENVGSLISDPAFEFHDLTEKNIDEEIKSMGFLSCDRAGTGAIILKRSVFEKMLPSTDEYIDEIGHEAKEVLTKNYFKYSIKNGKFIGEDWTFCDNWISIGGSIYLKFDAKTSHEGKLEYQYNFESLSEIEAKRRLLKNG